MSHFPVSIYFRHCFVVPLDDIVPSELDVCEECDADDGVLKLNEFDASDPDGLLSVLIRLYACPLLGDRDAL